MNSTIHNQHKNMKERLAGILFWVSCGNTKSKIKLLCTFTLFLLIISACNMPNTPYWLNYQSQNNHDTVAYLDAPLDGLPTATPFLPIPPTPTYIPVNLPTIEPTPEDQDTDQNGVPTIAAPKNYVRILLLGSDQRPFEGGYRTDVIILLTLKPDQGKASMVSFPRDLYVEIPSVGANRINTAMAYGGFSLLNQTLLRNFGVYADHYVMVNFWAFVQTIDSLGGINVHVAKTLTDHRDGYGQYTVPAGLVHMDGETALWYARSRYTSSDFDRNRRQQEIIRALFEKLMSLNAIERAPEIYNIYSQNVTTDLSLTDITPLLTMAPKLLDSSNIENYSIGPAYVTPWTTPGGAQVLLPNTAAIQGLLSQAMR